MAGMIRMRSTRSPARATTGHEWDGIRELNTPLPRWWLWIFYITIVWSVGYWIVYPAWPLVTTYTQGTFDWNSRSAVAADLAAINAARRRWRSLPLPRRGDLRRSETAGVRAGARPPRLRRQLRALSRRRRRRCEGLSQPERRRLAVGRQARRYRDHHPPRRPFDRPQGPSGRMPAFGRDSMLQRPDIVAVADYVRSLAGLPVAPMANLARGKKLFADNCAACHGDDGKGNRELGAPNLTDADLALRLRASTHHRRHRERPRRGDAALGRPARRHHHQGAGRLRPLARRRGEVSHGPATPQSIRRPRTAALPSSSRMRRAADDRTASRRRRPLYAPRRQIFPQSVKGTFRRIKWIVLIVTLGIYYLLPFVRWDRGPNAPDQAVLIDLPDRRFYFFFIEIWPQEIYYLTGLLILAAMTLFLMNAVAGRVWCGYLCPQTVWTDLFYASSASSKATGANMHARPGSGRSRDRAQGAKHFTVADGRVVDRRRLGALFRRRADAGEGSCHLPGPGDRLALDRHPHLHDLFARRLHARAGLHLYVPVAAHPGGADRRTRAERHLPLRPRRAARFAEAERAVAAAGLPAGDCIDCRQCVAVCPTGVDIRKGLQSTASSAAFASMPATRSWRRSTARRG